MKLIIGLGNPGEKYKKTRHNAGFMATDAIASNFQFSIFNFQTKFNSETAEKIISNEKIILAKPQTFMNESGKAVKATADYYKIPPENITVIHDDLDIPLGSYKLQFGKGPRLHNGVTSVENHLGTKVNLLSNCTISSPLSRHQNNAGSIG